MERISIKSEPSAPGMVSGGGQGSGEAGGVWISGGGGDDWLMIIITEMDNNRELNDVISVDGVITVNPEPNQLVEEDDDDCVILDGDPELMNMVETVSTGGDGDSDEVEVIGTRGEIACRDFPHSRHLCANYIFDSTPHEIHCHMCHCYVCDSPAPCVEWGTGMLVFDHCHATDKEDCWKRERNMLKSGVKEASASSMLIDSNNLPPSSILMDSNNPPPSSILIDRNNPPPSSMLIHNNNPPPSSILIDSYNPPRRNPQRQPNRVHNGWVWQQPHQHHYAIQNQFGRITPLFQVNHGAVRPNLLNQNTLHQVYRDGLSLRRLGRASLPPMNHPYAFQRSHFPSTMRARIQIPQSFQHMMPSWPNTGQSYFLIPPQTQLNTAAASTFTTQPRIMSQRMFSPQLVMGEHLASLIPSFQQNMGNLGVPYIQEALPVITGWNGNGLENHFAGESSSAAPANQPDNYMQLGLGSDVYYQVNP